MINPLCSKIWFVGLLCVAIAIVERGVEGGDIATVKRHALQLGYLCCERLKDNLKQKEFEHRMSEMNINFPLTDNTVNQVGINS